MSLTQSYAGQPPPPPDDGPLPASVGGFRIDRVLGRGGMGVVYAAHDPKLGRPVAVKVMRADCLTGPVQRERFHREARAAAALHHDHIVPVFQVGEEAGEPFLVMPLLPGRTLAARLKAGPVPLADALDIARQAADGLAAAHAAGIVHRDIKPANLFLEDRPGDGVRVRLLDFGLARSAVEDGGLTGPGAVMGTPAYMAPEQAFGQATDSRVDLYGLGGVLYHMLGGGAPFAGRGGDRDPAKLSLPATVPPALAELVRRLLAPDPAARPATAGAVVAELTAVRPATPPWRRWAKVAGVVGLVLVACYAATRPAKPPEPVPSAPSAGPAARGQTLPPPATDFAVLFDADRRSLRWWAATLHSRGLRPDAVSVRGDGPDVRFTAVAVADGQPWYAIVDATDADWDERIAGFADEQRPTGYVSYREAAEGDWRFTSFHVRAAGPGDCYVTESLRELQGKLDGDEWAGVRPLRLAACGRPPIYVITLTENRPAFAGVCLAERSRTDFDTEHRSAVANGLRLDAVDVSGTPGGPAFQAVWVKDGGTSDFALDLTRDQLDAQLADRRAARSRPYTLAAYDTPDGLRYAVTWVPMEKPRDAPAPAAGK